MSWTFGDYRFDTKTRQLFRGPTEVRLSPKAFDLLDVLIESRTRAVSKSELHERLWPKTFVTDANLAGLIAELRRALSHPPGAATFIRTVPRFGYAFTGEISADDEAVGPSTRRPCWIVWNNHEIPLHEGENIIGRDPDATVCLDFPSVSRRHARIMVSPDGASIEDLASKNGTFLRSIRITGRSRVADMDEVRVGSVHLMVRITNIDAATLTLDES